MNQSMFQFPLCSLMILVFAGVSASAHAFGGRENAVQFTEVNREYLLMAKHVPLGEIVQTLEAHAHMKFVGLSVAAAETSRSITWRGHPLRASVAELLMGCSYVIDESSTVMQINVAPSCDPQPATNINVVPARATRPETARESEIIAEDIIPAASTGEESGWTYETLPAGP